MLIQDVNVLQEFVHEQFLSCLCLLSSNLQLDLVLKELNVNPHKPQPRLPITPLILQRLLKVLRQDPQSYLNITMWAAHCLGYFAILHSGEIKVPSDTFTAADISVDDLTNPSKIRVFFKQSKTYQNPKVSCTVC